MKLLPVIKSCVLSEGDGGQAHEPEVVKQAIVGLIDEERLPLHPRNAQHSSTFLRQLAFDLLAHADTLDKD